MDRVCLPDRRTGSVVGSVSRHGRPVATLYFAEFVRRKCDDDVRLALEVALRVFASHLELVALMERAAKRWG